MKLWQYFTSLLLGLVCLGLSISIVALSSATRRIQQEINDRQTRLNTGILAPQWQQVGAAILQDMANAASRNPKMKSLLERHGYSVVSPQPAAGKGAGGEAETPAHEAKASAGTAKQTAPSVSEEP